MSAVTPTAGYPVHRVTAYARMTHPNGVTVTSWRSACGSTGKLVGGMATFSPAGQARRLELCRACFPSGDWGGYFPDPVEEIL